MEPNVNPLIFKILIIIDFEGFFIDQKYNSVKREKNLNCIFL